MHFAASIGSLKLCTALLDMGEKLTIQAKVEKLNRTPVHCAALSGHVDVLRAFWASDSGCLWAGDYNRDTALHVTARFGHVDAVRFMVEVGVPKGVLASVKRMRVVWAGALKVKTREGEIYRLLKKA